MVEEPGNGNDDPSAQSQEGEIRDTDDDETRNSAIPRPWYYAFAMGQAIAFSNASASSAQSSLSVRCHLNLPLSSEIVMYLVLATTFHIVLCRNKRLGGESRIRSREFLQVPSSLDSDLVNHLEQQQGQQEPARQSYSHSAIAIGGKDKAVQEELATDSANIEGEEDIGGIASSQSRLWRTIGQISGLSWSCFLRNSRWLIFALVALIDVEANFLLLFAFRYASLTSVQLLASLSVASIMLSSRFLMRKSFSYTQIIGVLLCIAGSLILIKSDWITAASNGTTTTTSNSTAIHDDARPHDDVSGDMDVESVSKSSVTPWGDLMALSGALLFGFNDALSEYAIKNASTAEYLAMVGSFGACFGTVQFLLLDQGEEWHQWRILLASEEPSCSTVTWVGYFLWFIVAVVCMYVAAGYFLASKDATLMGLSLQTANLYTVLFSVTIQHVFPSSYFYGAATLMTGGFVLYELQPSCPSRINRHHELDQIIGTASVERRERPFGSRIRTGNLDLT